jgi:glycine oxidase
MADAVVVGAGIIGLSTAFRLVERGWSVRVCDPAPAMGATRAAAGMLAPAAEVVWGQEALWPLMRDSAELYPELVERVESVTGMAAGYVRNETVVVGLDAADRLALDELTKQQTAFGMRAERLDALAARRLEPALGPGVVGVRLRDDHQLDPRRFTGALLAWLGDRVVREPVRSLRRVDGTTRGVILADGTEIAAEQTVIATGRALLPELSQLPLRSVHGDILRLRFAPERPPLIDRTVRALVRGRPCYVVPRPGGELVVGATSREDGRDGVSAEGVHRLLEDARRALPGLLEADLAETMARARPGTPDDLPLIGRIDDGAVVSTGYFRHGILLAPLGSALTAALTTGEPVDRSTLRAVDPERFAMAGAGAPNPSHHQEEQE